MRVLLTGATGFIGRHLIPVLQAAGHEVTGAGRQPARPPGADIGWITWDMASGAPPPLPEVDAVMHLAQANARLPDGALEIHTLATTAALHLLEHARRCGAERFVLASTGNVYGFSDRPFVESDPQRPSGLYASAKCYAENLVESFQPFLRTAILRLFGPYGPGQTARLIPDIIARVRESRPVVLKGGGQPRLTPIFITDVCELFTRSLSIGTDAKVNLAGDEHAGLREIAEIAGSIMGITPALQISDEPGCGDLTGDNRAMKALFGDLPLVPLREGIRRAIEG
ncbi:MAG: NAD(P)-dependent oxidoreductase [Verrucomicrobiaceae bacterium]|nr:NAD(P)-dependent oxidoreductase [Verrucomicrobiaceae bacterium]